MAATLWHAFIIVENLVSQLAASLPAAKTLEQLTRPLLDILGAVTGMESTYLTAIDLQQDVQQVRFARNAGLMKIPEGLEVSWSDTLCKRTLDEGCQFTNDVAQRWADSDAASALGIQTYLSAPVRSEEGRLLGTICAASAEVKPIPIDAQTVITLFSTLISGFIERERLLRQLQSANESLRVIALNDALTGLPNRRSLYETLEIMLARASEQSESVIVGLMDLDGFKQINDKHGHHAGDALLCAVGRRVSGALRPSDVLGRLGGDEFMLVAAGPADDAHARNLAQTLEQRMQAESKGEYVLNDIRLSYAGASVGVIAFVPGQHTHIDADIPVRLADARMYEVKRQRRNRLS
ncbi:sensor domain-containing diguanylate cyclase [Bordetella holmesii]|uniref:sensor domain-containing diguanylate cyclase n=1 Tax=Bordetella holmesii TaxID=35814 RepID=UPI0012985E33|nr:sensor domain-containing diguanylate cyclase [Bordetella holmesii]QGD29124.1 sensor domain-containing diguanylate cyclase [Bordetella holmesii]